MSCITVCLFIVIVVRECAAQDIAGGDASCYCPGSIATSVIVTIIVTVLLVCVLFAIWKRYWKNRQEKHLILETDPERGNNVQYAFDNAGFKNTSTIPTLNSTPEKNNKSTDSIKTKWSQWSPLSALILNKNEKQKTLDDSAIRAEQVKTVLLKSHDFTGLGFNIYGNMREGIFIKDLLHRGPASESGMLNPGDRIKSVTINFEHVVYEDALTILSYASPYEVTLEAKNGRMLSSHQQSASADKTMQLGHPVYRSSSSADLTQIKQPKKRLFPDEPSSPYTTLNKNVNITTSTLENKRPQSPSSLKTQLEEKLTANHQELLKQKNSNVEVPVETVESPKTTEHKYQKFGIKVLPIELKTDTSPKTTEQNDNNINLEIIGVDMVDLNEFVRENSGIKRDKNGIPQEIPNHMLNAAVAAKRNRRGSAETTSNNDDSIKSPKRSKGRAPAPPVTEKYVSDSENENDSVNTIELNSSDITIHHAEEINDRKTASTGDLTKLQKSHNGTLERAQSLDITDTSLPDLGKKQNTESTNESFDNSESGSDDSIYKKGLIHKEPRLSLDLEGLNTFQRNRLKKSTEWGNLEDAINIHDSNNEIEAVISRINEIKHENPELSFETHNGMHEVDTSSEHEESLNLIPHHILVSENFLLNERDASSEDPFYNLNNACDDIKVSLSLEKPDDLVSNVTVLENKNDDLYLTAIDTSLINNDVTIEGPSSLKVEIPDDQTLVSNAIFNISSPPAVKQTNHTYITEIQVTTPIDPENELSKIHEIAEEQLKMLPEMRFSTSSYDITPPKSPENTQVDQIRSTFEKTTSRSKTPPRLETKSRIPVATPSLKTPPMSPERRDSRIFNTEIDKEIFALMSSTPINIGRPKTPNKNVSVTSIRSSSKIPSGLPGRPPVPPRKYEDAETNGNSSFKQWVFHPSE